MYACMCTLIAFVINGLHCLSLLAAHLSTFSWLTFRFYNAQFLSFFVRFSFLFHFAFVLLLHGCTYTYRLHVAISN